eukprot:symbB.v1.2.037448.t2/scaffold5534.1/size26050/5
MEEGGQDSERTRALRQGAGFVAMPDLPESDEEEKDENDETQAQSASSDRKLSFSEAPFMDASDFAEGEGWAEGDWRDWSWEGWAEGDWSGMWANEAVWAHCVGIHEVADHSTSVVRLCHRKKCNSATCKFEHSEVVTRESQRENRRKAKGLATMVARGS